MRALPRFVPVRTQSWARSCGASNTSRAMADRGRSRDNAFMRSAILPGNERKMAGVMRRWGFSVVDDLVRAKKSVLTIVRDFQRAGVVRPGKIPESVYTLHAAYARPVERGTTAGTVKLHVGGLAVPVESENEENASALGRARIHFHLVPALRHLAIDPVHVPRKFAAEIAFAH